MMLEDWHMSSICRIVNSVMKRIEKFKRLSKKRRQEILRKSLIVAGYVFATCFVVFGTIILVAYGSGYSYDFKNGKLVHRGLLILESKPSGATVKLGNRQLSEKTPYRRSFEEGSYEITLTKDDYRTWNKTLDVIPSRVNLAQYVILLPQRFQVEPVISYPSIKQSIASRDRKKIAYNVPTGSSPGIYVMDTGSRSQKKVYSLAAPVEGQPSESVEISEWSDDASKLLVRQTIGDKISYLIVSMNNDPVINLSQDLNVSFTNLRFSLSTWRTLYWNTTEGLKRVDVDEKSVSAPITGPVGGYNFAGDRIIYVDAADPNKPLWLIETNGRKKKLVESLPASGSYAIDYSTYINVPQIVVSANDANQSFLISDAFDKPNKKLISTFAGSPLFNGDGRFVVIRGQDNSGTFDLELNKLYQFTQPNNKISGVTWFDNYHLQFNRDGQSVISEFDGNYANVITRGDSLPPSNTQDGDYLFSTSQTSTGTTLIKALKLKL